MTAEKLNRNSVVRAAAEEDLKAVSEIDRASFSSPWNYNFLKTGLEDIFLVIEKEREILGYLIACCCDNISKAIILKIAVHPDHRGKGAATKLLRTCLEILSQKDIKVVELDVDIVKRNVVALYEKFGFKIATTISTPDEDDSFFIMRLELGK